MPYKPKKPCAYPGCKNLTHHTYCDVHRNLVSKEYDKYQRLPDHAKKYGIEWKRARDRYIKLHPLCECCLKEGRMIPAQEVHHILPVSRAGTNDETNLMSLCKSCHNKIHIKLGDRHVHE